MNNVSNIREVKSLTRQASEWLVVLESGDATDEDRARAAAWLREHPAHRAAFEELNHTWGRLHAMGERVRSAGDNHIDSELVARPDRPGLSRWRPAAGAAAAAVVVAAMLGLEFFESPESNAPYRTDVGERSTISLPDGTTVELNTDSELLVDYSAEFRRVTLRRGEAYFDVSRDEARPFVVGAGHGAITAVGTGFLVRVQPDDVVAVTVTEGIVEVTHAAQRAPTSSTPERVPAPKLTKGQRVQYDRQDTRLEVVVAEELERSLAWRQGLLMFDGQSLAEVLQEVGRYTNTRLIISDPELRNLRIGGAFRAGDVEALLEVLEKGFGISTRRDGEQAVYLHVAPAAATR